MTNVLVDTAVAQELAASNYRRFSDALDVLAPHQSVYSDRTRVGMKMGALCCSCDPEGRVDVTHTAKLTLTRDEGLIIVGLNEFKTSTDEPFLPEAPLFYHDSSAAWQVGNPGELFGGFQLHIQDEGRQILYGSRGASLRKLAGINSYEADHFAVACTLPIDKRVAAVTGS